MTVPELKALARECRLRNYSRLRKAELIELFRNNQRNANPPLQNWEPNRPLWPKRAPLPPPTQTWEPIDDRPRQPELGEAPLTKRQLKCMRNRNSKLAKKFKSLDAEISNLKSQMEALKDKITKASKSTHSGFKRKKIRSMKVDMIAKKVRESKKKLKLVEPRVPKDPISGPPSNYTLRIDPNIKRPR